MSDSNNTNKRRNITGSYPGVTGSYRKNSASAQPQRKEQPKPQAPTKITHEKKKAEFDFKLWFSKVNVKLFTKHLKYYGTIVAVSLILTACIVSVANDVFAFIKPDESIKVTIAEGGRAKDAAKALADAGVIKYKSVFALYCKLKKADGTFKSGDYTLGKDFDYNRLISKLKRNPVDTETVNITVKSGMTQDEIIEKLESAKLGTLTELETAFNTVQYKKYSFVKKLPDRRARLEGYLPAGEYEFYVGQSATSIVSDFLARFEETVLTEETNKLIKASKKSVDEIITTASLIESECDDAESFKTVASVINNRLGKKNDGYLMLTCSINYLLENTKSELTEDDILAESEYNTYMYPGLPKGPVCTPSPEAIAAVLSPEGSNYSYFISNNGKTYFASTKEEHKNQLEDLEGTIKGTDTIK